MSEEVVYEQKIEIPSECQLSLDDKKVSVTFYGQTTII